MKFVHVLLATAIVGKTQAKTPVHVPGWPTLPFPFSTALISYNGAIHVSGMQGVSV